MRPFLNLQVSSSVLYQNSQKRRGLSSRASKRASCSMPAVGVPWLGLRRRLASPVSLTCSSIYRRRAQRWGAYPFSRHRAGPTARSAPPHEADCPFSSALAPNPSLVLYTSINTLLRSRRTFQTPHSPCRLLLPTSNSFARAGTRRPLS